MTPEGKIKAGIREVLKKYSSVIYYHMPVPTGFGRSSLDYIGFAAGLGFAIEAKRPRGKPTGRQETTIEQIERAGARVFVINSYDGIAALDKWLMEVTKGELSNV